MPLYEYRCTSCGYSFEKIQNFSAKPETECPKCQGVLVRPITAPALRFEGAGWYVNDYAGKGGSKSNDKSAESKGGEISGGDSSDAGAPKDAKSGGAAASAGSAPSTATTAPAATAPTASSISSNRGN